MKIPTLRKIIYTTLALTVLTGCGQKPVPSFSEADSLRSPLEVWIFADLHYLASSLHDDGSAFQQLMEQGDGKLSEYSEQIADELIRLALERHPDAVIIPGDLTFNGELISLQELCGKLKNLTSAGIPVLVLPGNHDLYYPYARSYFGANPRKTSSITPEQFRSICGEFGWDQALATDRDSYSYVYELTDDVELMFLDANTIDAPGRIPESTLSWAKKQLRWAKEDGKQVITVTHQSILPQNRFMTSGFLMDNSEQVSKLLRKTGVALNLSGHIHIQHTAEENGLTDIATGCACVAPLRYGILRIGTSSTDFEYTPCRLEILQSEAEERFDTCMSNQITSSLKDLEVPSEHSMIMLQFMLDLNRSYFAGKPIDAETWRNTDGYQLWKKYAPETSWYYYIESILS